VSLGNLSAIKESPLAEKRKMPFYNIITLGAIKVLKVAFIKVLKVAFYYFCLILSW